MYSARILKDSIAPSGFRLTTIEATYPRLGHADMMTHRKFSRNAGSSRAIPVKKSLETVMNDPVIPVWWGRAQSGMQAQEELSEDLKPVAKQVWLEARDHAAFAVEQLIGEKQVFDTWGDLQRVVTLDLHKQIPNRLLEPWSWITVIITATDWQNFFRLRCSPYAQPEVQKIAYMIKEAYDASNPEIMEEGAWHLPLLYEEDFQELDQEFGDTTPEYWEKACQISVGRCARVSYLTHDGQRSHEKDIALFESLLTNGHWSPFEHVAQAGTRKIPSGNIMGWKQYRKNFPGEEGDERDVVYLSRKEAEGLATMIEALVPNTYSETRKWMLGLLK